MQKSRIIRYMVYFLGIIFLCTIISRSIYDYLLPVVTTTGISQGGLENVQYATGKVGLDEDTLKREQIAVISPMAGRMSQMTKVEGDYVKKGEQLGVVTKKEDYKEQKEEAITQVELTQTITQTARSKEQKQSQIESLKAVNKEKQKELEQIDSNLQLVSLNEQIKTKNEAIEANEALLEVGAISVQEQTKTIAERDELVRSLEQKKKELTTTLTEAIKANKEQITTLELEIKALSDTATLASKKLEKGKEEQTQEVLVSPVSGYIQTINVANSAYVNENDKLLVVVPENIAYNLSFELAEEAANQVTMGQKVSFSWAQLTHEAKVIKKGFNDKTGNIVIICEVEPEVLNQMNLSYTTYRMVNVCITAKSEEYQMTVNNSALQRSNNETCVYVVEEKEQMGRTTYILRKVSVSIIQEGDLKSAISGNLDTSMKLVDNQLADLVDGQEVVIE